MSKRPSIDLMALTSDPAAPMPEAVQRTAPPAAPLPRAAAKPKQLPPGRPEPVKTENLESLAFKVPPVFRKRFRQCAAAADLKLNELLFEALTAWEEKQGLEK